MMPRGTVIAVGDRQQCRLVYPGAGHTDARVDADAVDTAVTSSDQDGYPFPDRRCPVSNPSVS